MPHILRKTLEKRCPLTILPVSRRIFSLFLRPIASFSLFNMKFVECGRYYPVKSPLDWEINKKTCTHCIAASWQVWSIGWHCIFWGYVKYWATIRCVKVCIDFWAWRWHCFSATFDWVEKSLLFIRNIFINIKIEINWVHLDCSGLVVFSIIFHTLFSIHTSIQWSKHLTYVKKFLVAAAKHNRSSIICFAIIIIWVQSL